MKTLKIKENKEQEASQEISFEQEIQFWCKVALEQQRIIHEKNRT